MNVFGIYLGALNEIIPPINQERNILLCQKNYQEIKSFQGKAKIVSLAILNNKSLNADLNATREKHQLIIVKPNNIQAINRVINDSRIDGLILDNDSNSKIFNRSNVKRLSLGKKLVFINVEGFWVNTDKLLKYIIKILKSYAKCTYIPINLQSDVYELRNSRNLFTSLIHVNPKLKFDTTSLENRIRENTLRLEGKLYGDMVIE